jgi:hypothetical protein
MIPSRPHFMSLALLSCIATAALACGKAEVARPGGATGSEGGGPRGGPPGGMQPGLELPDGGPVDGAAPKGGGPGVAPVTPGAEACATEVHKAERLPVDLLLLLDVSTSMEERPPGEIRRKGDLIREALTTFIKDPRSAGLGIGLRLFPPEQPPPPSPPPVTSAPCQSDTECGPHTACRSPRVCFTANGPGGGPIMNACRGDLTGGPDGCPFGGTCVPAGRCSLSNQQCYPPGQPCSNGNAADVCQAIPLQCLPVLGGAACEAATYDKTAVPIAALPGAESAMVQALQGVTYWLGTPMGPAVAAALAHARDHQTANPARRVAMVLATDGVPSTCQPSDPAGISALAAAEAMRTPPISTYAIGVFGKEELQPGRALLDSVATAGGTDAPFVLNNDPDIARTFLDALEKIRQASLPCEFVIPAPKGPIDFGRVNLRLQDAAGTAQDIPYVAAANRCDPMRGGWYYDVDPAKAPPTRVLTCPATCHQLKTGADGNVSLIFGCKTIVID